MVHMFQTPVSNNEQHDAAPPSPAIDSLQENLEHNRTLKKKASSSWFNSITGTLSKGSSKIATVFSNSRPHGDGSDNNARDCPLSPSSMQVERPSTPRPRRSTSGSEQPTAAHTPPKQHDHTPKGSSAFATIRSVRKRMTGHSSKQKRASVKSITYSPQCEMPGAEGPERFSCDTQRDSKTSRHSRIVSFDSVRGIKSFARKASVRRSAYPPDRKHEPADRPPLDELWKRENEAEHDSDPPPVSLPVDIPGKAPQMLDVDLGGPAFASSTWTASPEKEQEAELRKLADPNNITSGLPDDRRLHIPRNLELSRQCQRISPTGPPRYLKAFLRPSMDLGDDPWGSALREDGPPTPMPGTNLPLEFDGASGDDVPVFERSVESADASPEKGPKVVREMRSLNALTEAIPPLGRHEGAKDSTDAIAEASTIAHKQDEEENDRIDAIHIPLVQLRDSALVSAKQAAAIHQEARGKVLDMSQQHGETNPLQRLSPGSTSSQPEPTTPHLLTLPSPVNAGTAGDASPATTVHTLPSDMDELSPQPKAPRRMFPKEDDKYIQWQKQNLKPAVPPVSFTDGDLALGSERNQLRWKEARLALKEAVSKHERAKVEPEAETGPPSPTKSVTLPIRCKVPIEPTASICNLEGVDWAGLDGALEDSSTSTSPIDSLLEEPCFVAASGDSGTGNAAMPCEEKPTCRLVDQSPSPAHQSYEEDKENEPPLPDFEARDNDSIITDYDELKQHMFLNDEYLNGSDADSYPDPDSPSGSPSRLTPLAQRLYHAIGGTHSSSPTSSRTTGLRSTDVGEVFHRFSVHNWLGDVDDPEEQAGPATPRNRVYDASVDDSSVTTEKDISPFSPASGATVRTPSMGDRLDQNLQRSQLNMQYNAAQAVSSSHVSQASMASDRPALAELSSTNSPASRRVPVGMAASPRAPVSKRATKKQSEPGHVKQHSTGSVASQATITSFDENLDSTMRASSRLEHIMAEDRPEDAVATSSPMQLTAWEAANFQTANSGFATGAAVDKRRVQHSWARTTGSWVHPSPKETRVVHSPTDSRTPSWTNRFELLAQKVDPSSPCSEATEAVSLPRQSSRGLQAEERLEGFLSPERLGRTDRLLSSSGSGYGADKSSSGLESPQHKIRTFEAAKAKWESVPYGSASKGKGRQGRLLRKASKGY